MAERTRILVLGASGMLGHRLTARLAAEFEVAGTIRDGSPSTALQRLLPGIRLYPNVQAGDAAALRIALTDWAAGVLVNCIGLVKQVEAASEPLRAIRLNALLPHELYELAAERGARFIHISTDCVFSGRSGPYSEASVPDPEDLYGRTKLLGEVAGGGALTLRTSLIGREVATRNGLLEWFLAQRGKRVRGYNRALFSGLTTQAASELIARIVRSHRDLDGLWHASGEPISKHDLLQLVNRVYGLGVAIEPDSAVMVDRTLDSRRLRERIGWRPPSWDDMLAATHAEDAIYDG